MLFVEQHQNGGGVGVMKDSVDVVGLCCSFAVVSDSSSGDVSCSINEVEDIAKSGLKYGEELGEDASRFPMK